MSGHVSELVVSEIASPLPTRYSCQRTVFRLWYRNTTVALLSPGVDVVLLEDHAGVPGTLARYILGYRSRTATHYDLNKLSHFQHFIKKIRKDTGLFLWVEKVNLRLTPFMELSLLNTRIVQKGFIESIIVASITLADANYSGSTWSAKGEDIAPSPTTVLEFSFDDVF